MTEKISAPDTRTLINFSNQLDSIPEEAKIGDTKAIRKNKCNLFCIKFCPNYYFYLNKVLVKVQSNPKCYS